MATTIRDRGGRQKILEGLWLIGIEPTQLGISPDVDGTAFIDALHKNGVHDEFIRRAIAAVDWRADDRKPLPMRIADWLRASGYREDEVARFNDELRKAGGTESPTEINGILTRLFNERTAGAVLHKATGGKGVEGAVWNPFRTDTPPKGVNMKFGGGGILATNLPAGMSYTEPPNPKAYGGERVRPAQTAGVPTPPPGIGRTPPAAPPGPATPHQPLAPPKDQKAPGGPGGPAGGGLPAMPDTRPVWQREGREPTPQEIDDFVHDNFGADAWFMDVPEIKAELTQMARDGITDPAEARRRISATQWYKNTASSARLWHAKERSDPASAMSDITEQTDFLQAQADQLGVTVEPARLRYIAESSLRFGWSPSQINRAIAAEFRYDPKSKVQATKVVEMKEQAKKYLVPLSDEAIQTWATGLMSGQFNQASYDQYLKDTAKSLFPQLVSAIDQGMTVAEYVDPYKQIAAQTLEMNPDTIDFMDPKWRQAFDQKDDKGNRTIMTLSEWSSKIRTDKTYGYDKTQRGVQEASQFANSLLRKFGAIA